jgi:hypothetical protein
MRMAFPWHGVATVLPDDPTSTQFGTMLRATLFPALPAAEPNATTTAFENLGRGLMFRGKQWQQYDGKSLRIVHDPQPKSFACNAWFEAASAARARLVMLHTPGTEAADETARIAEFVRAARGRGFAVGLSMSLGPKPEDASRLHDWELTGRSTAERLLTSFGPIALLRIEVPVESKLWAYDVGNELYRAARIVAPHSLIEFVAVDDYGKGGVRGPNGLQRVGTVSTPYADLRYEGGQAPRSEELWPTDVVADFDDGPIEFSGVAGRYLRRLPSPDGDEPWRIVDGRRHYVPLQVELMLSRFMDLEGASQPRKTSARHGGFPIVDFGEELRVATLRTRNILVVVTFEADGRLSSETVDELRELGKR